MRRGSGLLVLAAVLLLAGCSGIPASGSVNSAVARGGSQPGQVSITPAKPTPGAKPADIVRGFLNAATGESGDFGVARQYLTPAFRSRWNARAGVTVVDGTPAVDADGKRAVVDEVGTVDAAGTYTAFPAPSPRPLDFSLQQVSGQWRIDSAPGGVVLPSELLSRVFSLHQLEFFTPDWREAVPDLRWFVGVPSATTVVRRLLAGAAGPVASPVTVTAFPTGTTLRHPVAVAPSGTVATVDLHFAGDTPTTAVLERIRTQLEQTLGTLNIDEVSLDVDGSRAAVAAWPLTPVGAAQSSPLVLRGASFGYLSDRGLIQFARLGTPVVKSRPTGITTSAARPLAAVRTRTGEIESVTPTKVVPLGRSAIDPSLDPQGWIWAVPANDPSTIQVFAGAQHRQLDLPPEGGSEIAEIQSIEVSRDGARVLLVLDTGGAPRVVVAGIERAKNGAPIGLAGHTDLYVPTDPKVVDATWVDSARIAVLTKDKSGANPVIVHAVGGLATPDGQLTGAQAVVGGQTLADLTVRAGSNIWQTSRGTTIWQSLGAGIDLIAVQR